jgi:hypothetical protein
MSFHMTRSVKLAVLGLIALPLLVAAACNLQPDQSSLETCGGAVALEIAPTAYPAPSASSIFVINGATNGAWCGVQSVTVLQSFSAAPAAPSGSNLAYWSAQVPLATLEALPPCLDGAGGSVMVTAQATINGAPIEVDATVAGGPELAIETSECVTFTHLLPGSTCETPNPSSSLPDDTPVVQLPLSPGPGILVSFYSDTATLLGRPVTWKSLGGLVSPLPSSPLVASWSAAEAGMETEAGMAADAEEGATVSCPSKTSTVYASSLLVPGATSGVDTVTASLDGFGPPAAIWNVALQGPAKLAANPAAFTSGGTVVVTVQNPMGFLQNCTFTLPASVVASEWNSDAGDASVLYPGSLEAGSDTYSQSSPNILQTYTLSLPPGVAAPTTPLIVECVDSFSQVSILTIPASAATDGAAPAEAGADASAGGGITDAPSDGG